MNQGKLESINALRNSWINAEHGSIGKKLWANTLIIDHMPYLMSEIERLQKELDEARAYSEHWRESCEAHEDRLIANNLLNLDED